MALDPDLIQTRREKARRRMLTNRAFLVGCALTLLVVPLAALFSGGGSPHPRPRLPITRRAHPQRPQAVPWPQQERALAEFLRLGLPLYCGGLHRPYVALTFDDGPGAYTQLALSYLRRARVRATFFLVGRNLPLWSSFPAMELRIGALGDHTYNHPYLPSLSTADVRRELKTTQHGIAALTGFETRLFRPPYGAFNSTIERLARSLGMLTVLWNVDSQDSLGADSRLIAANVVRGLRPGSIILMHENHGQTIHALRRSILPALRRRRLRAVTIPELLALDPPSSHQLRARSSGCPISAGISRTSG